MSKRNDKGEKPLKGQWWFPLTGEIKESEAWKCLSCRAVRILVESVPIGGKVQPWDWTSDEVFTIVYKDFKRYMGRNQFYEARKKLVEYGFFEEIDDGIPKDPKKKGLSQQKTKFRKDVKWRSISKVLKEEKDRKAHSEKMKKRFKDADFR